jgi:hypothetical protein
VCAGFLPSGISISNFNFSYPPPPQFLAERLDGFRAYCALYGIKLDSSLQSIWIVLLITLRHFALHTPAALHHDFHFPPPPSPPPPCFTSLRVAHIKCIAERRSGSLDHEIAQQSSIGLNRISLVIIIREVVQLHTQGCPQPSRRLTV